jgi:hypothetical protein
MKSNQRNRRYQHGWHQQWREENEAYSVNRNNGNMNIYNGVVSANKEISKLKNGEERMV